MFAIEREAMDRDGLVLQALDDVLPPGRVLDVAAGDGFTGDRLAAGRRIVALEPSAAMIRDRPLTWVRGDAAHLPFIDESFEAAYATWAYFFSRDWDPTPGIAELDRVVRSGGRLAIVDNLGGDAFAAMADADISADPAWWAAPAFEIPPIETASRFVNPADSRRLLGFFFGERGIEGPPLEVPFPTALSPPPTPGACPDGSGPASSRP